MTGDGSSSVVDAWAQPALSGGFERIPEVARLFRQSGTFEMLQKGATPDETVRLMDEAGVERALLCAWHRPGGWVFSNDDVAEFVRRYPDRFVGVASVNLERPMEAVKELDRAVRDLGFRALRVLPWLWRRPPNDRLYYPLYVKCVELGIPFCTQVGHTGPLMPSEPGRPVPYLDEVALDFPELRIVAGHIGHPWTEEAIGLAWKHENVYLDTSAHLPRYYPPAILQFARSHGQDKVLFGTNFPQLPFGKAVAQARALDLPPDAMRKFLGGNARRVFRL